MFRIFRFELKSECEKQQQCVYRLKYTNIEIFIKNTKMIMILGVLLGASVKFDLKCDSCSFFCNYSMTINLLDDDIFPEPCEDEYKWKNI